MEIKRFGIENIDAAMKFDKFCFPTDYWKEEDWKDLLSDERAIYYALCDGYTLIGDVFIYNWQGKKDYVKIMNIAIHPDYRKQGFARMLLYHVMTEMTKIGMKRFCGETRATNKAMQHVFTACGYQLSTIEEEYYHNPTESAYKYVLQL